MYKEKWGHLSDQVSSGKSPEGQELVSQDTSKRLLDRSNQRPHDFGPVLLSMWRHSQWMNEQIVLTATKMKDSSFSTNKMIFQTCAQTCPTSLEITHWHSFPIGTSLLHHLTFFLSTTSWRVATDSARTSKKGLLGSVRFHTFSCARGHHDPIGGPKNDLWARKVPGDTRDTSLWCQVGMHEKPLTKWWKINSCWQVVICRVNPNVWGIAKQADSRGPSCTDNHEKGELACLGGNKIYIRYFEATNTHKHNKRGYQYISILWNQIKTTLRLLTCFHLFICSSSSQLRTPWRNCRLEGIPIIQNLRNTATSDSGNISKLKKHPHCIVSKSHFTHPPPNIPWYWPFELQMTSKIQHVNTSLTNPVIYKYISWIYTIF